jgi:ribosomal protein S27AE
MKHLHILKRVSKSKDLFMCADPECNWTRNRKYLTGKKFICPFCGNPYLVDAKSLRLSTPHCSNCTDSPRVIIVDPLVSKLVDGLVQIMPLSEVKDETNL